MSSSLDVNVILQYLPHRFPFLLVDRVLEVEPGKSIVAIKNVTYNEPFFTGHFPQRPIMPGVLIVEALAQTSGILIYKTTETMPNTQNWFFLAGVDNARFKRIVEPGDQLHMKVELLRARHDLWKFQATASVDGELACSAEIMNIKGAVE